MKALFIGGTGTISTHISELAVARGWELTLLNRGNRPAPSGAATLTADIADEAEAARLLKGMAFDVVADFIAYTPDQVERDIRLFSQNTGQYIFISSASAYKRPPDTVYITESTPLYNPNWQYSRDKIACEDTLLTAYRNDAFPMTIVRPSHTYCDRSIPVPLHGRNGSWQTLQRMREGKPVIVHGDGATLWTVTHSEDFAKAFLGLMGNPHAVGEAYHITSDFSPTWNEIFLTAARALGVQPNLRHIASDFLVACDDRGFNLRGSLCGDKAACALFDNTKIKRLVPGFRAEITFEQGVRRALAYILDHLECQPPDPEFDDWCDRVLAVYDGAADAFRRK